ncbi:hypothetical protein [Roseofilum capinflatum]|uniref:Uncharacterized protein n=1 Tax=Roseofilum capinflatum BLCC-M114 TaxID=3022440 RepID=A0ABT7B5Q6_9CYAN|nr:hypothetical protein [Roseofilum capinflatum]MDJ1174157.1 hypothetical protein [Roseofilum capinflatum BLCC-M114]
MPKFPQSLKSLLTNPSVLLLALLLLLLPKSAMAGAMKDSASGNSTPEAAATPMNPTSEYSDPLDSPYPIPWNWVMNTYAEVSAADGSGLRYYRTPSLVSPDGQYAAYSRIQFQVRAQLHSSRVTSVMFLENLQTGNLEVVTAASPLANNPFDGNPEAQLPGVITMLVPVSWSELGDRLLARQFEGLFSSSTVSDYAVIWNRNLNKTTTIAPSQVDYSHAVLLGWSEHNANHVLFRAGILGDENWPMWAVNPEGKTLLATGDRPQTFGRSVSEAWAGPQAHYRR